MELFNFFIIQFDFINKYTNNEFISVFIKFVINLIYSSESILFSISKSPLSLIFNILFFWSKRIISINFFLSITTPFDLIFIVLKITISVNVD